jgi:hypothetical protein
MSREAWCRHYNGMGMGKTCEAGVEYAPLYDIEYTQTGKGLGLPCTEPSLKGRCLKHEVWTPEEIAADKKALDDFLQGFEDLNSRKTEECCHCHRAVDRMKQVGRCVYAEPCGCRLWQGTIPEAWR